MKSCVLCEQKTIVTRHHLIPRTLHRNKWFKKNFSREEMNETIDLCKSCHREVHKFIPEKEMGKSYYTLELLKSHPKIINYVAWIKKKVERNAKQDKHL